MLQLMTQFQQLEALRARLLSLDQAVAIAWKDGQNVAPIMELAERTRLEHDKVWGAFYRKMPRA